MGVIKPRVRMIANGKAIVTMPSGEKFFSRATDGKTGKPVSDFRGLVHLLRGKS